MTMYLTTEVTEVSTGYYNRSLLATFTSKNLPMCGKQKSFQNPSITQVRTQVPQKKEEKNEREKQQVVIIPKIVHMFIVATLKHSFVAPFNL